MRSRAYSSTYKSPSSQCAGWCSSARLFAIGCLSYSLVWKFVDFGDCGCWLTAFSNPASYQNYRINDVSAVFLRFGKLKTTSWNNVASAFWHSASSGTLIFGASCSSSCFRSWSYSGYFYWSGWASSPTIASSISHIRSLRITRAFCSCSWSVWSPFLLDY